MLLVGTGVQDGIPERLSPTAKVVDEADGLGQLPMGMMANTCKPKENGERGRRGKRLHLLLESLCNK